jgi:AhpD family alkylhydroperoxidase
VAAAGAEQLREMNARLVALSKATPQVFGAFHNLLTVSSKDGVLPAKIKELVAVAVAVHQGSEDCIVFHVSNAKKGEQAVTSLARFLASQSKWEAAREQSMRQKR